MNSLINAFAKVRLAIPGGEGEGRVYGVGSQGDTVTMNSLINSKGPISIDRPFAEADIYSALAEAH
eukprot:scaffold2827_cov87-Isochrysis_galbana.AAC.1